MDRRDGRRRRARSAAPEAEAGAAPPWVERWILPFVKESTLWPVLLVVMGHGAALLAPLLLLGLRERRPSALAATALLLVATARAVRAEFGWRGRPGALGVLLCITWLLGAGLAVLLHRRGFF